MSRQAPLRVHFARNAPEFTREVPYANAHGRTVLDVNFRLGHSGRSDRFDCGRGRSADEEVNLRSARPMTIESLRCPYLVLPSGFLLYLQYCSFSISSARSPFGGTTPSPGDALNAEHRP